MEFEGTVECPRNGGRCQAAKCGLFESLRTDAAEVANTGQAFSLVGMIACDTKHEKYDRIPWQE